jgi:hypothetical protein
VPSGSEANAGEHTSQPFCRSIRIFRNRTDRLQPSIRVLQTQAPPQLRAPRGRAFRSQGSASWRTPGTTISSEPVNTATSTRNKDIDAADKTRSKTLDGATLSSKSNGSISSGPINTATNATNAITYYRKRVVELASQQLRIGTSTCTGTQQLSGNLQDRSWKRRW